MADPRSEHDGEGEGAEDALVPFQSPDGSRGLMDQKTAQYLRSTLPQPTNAALAALLARVVRVRVVAPIKGPVEADIQDPKAIEALRDVLVIPSDAATGHCMCFGDPHLEFYGSASDQPLATIGVHHGHAIRWEAVWKDDARLANGFGLLRWLADHGAPSALRAFQEDQRRAEEFDRERARWLGACPQRLRPLVESMDSDGMIVSGGGADGPTPEWLPGAEAVLEAQIGERSARVLALCDWYGHGTRWSGFPSYEELPEAFLRRYSARDLVEAPHGPLTTAQLEGAARHFCGWKSPHGGADLPDALRTEFVRHALASGDEDRVIRATNTQLRRVKDVALRAPLEQLVLAFRTEQARLHTPTVSTPPARLREIAEGLSTDLWPEGVLAELDPALRRLWACDCAERVLHFFDEVCPDDPRPRQTIEVARRYAEGQANVLELERAWYEARDAGHERWKVSREARDAQDSVVETREFRAEQACSAARTAADVPGSTSLDFKHAANCAEDAVVGVSRYAPGRRARSKAGQAEREWQRRRLAELILRSLP